MYDRILVPTDGSAGVERAVEHAVELAAAHGATLHAVYVVNTGSFAALPVESSWEGVSDMLHEEGRAALARVRELAADRDVPVEAVLLEGRPSREIVRYAEAEGCDLVAMGTHGRGGIDRLLLGSVAERVVRSSSVPVLTVRIGDRPAPDEGEAEPDAGGEQPQPDDADGRSRSDAADGESQSDAAAPDAGAADAADDAEPDAGAGVE